MKRILSIIAGLVMGLGMVANATPYAYKNAVVVWHGNANQPPTGSRGWWQSAIVWGETSSWWYYAPNVSATMELYSVDYIRRYSWLTGNIPLGYTYQGYSCGTTSGSAGNTSSSLYTLAEELDEEWPTTDVMWRYTYSKELWVLRVTLSTPWNSTPSAPLPPGPTAGSAVLEVVVWSAFNATILGSYPLSIPEGAVTVDFLIDHGNYNASVLNSWTGTPDGPVSNYFTQAYSPQYPVWGGWID